MERPRAETPKSCIASFLGYLALPYGGSIVDPLKCRGRERQHASPSPFRRWTALQSSQPSIVRYGATKVRPKWGTLRRSLARLGHFKKCHNDKFPVKRRHHPLCSPSCPSLNLLPILKHLQHIMSDPNDGMSSFSFTSRSCLSLSYESLFTGSDPCFSLSPGGSRNLDAS